MAEHDQTIDWLAVKTEYVNGRGSYRQLAEKYNIKKSTLHRRAEREHWTQLRDKQRDTIERRVLEKSTEKIATNLANAYGDQAATRARIKGKLLKMAERWIDEQDGKIQDAGDYRRIVQCCMDMLDAAEFGTEQKLRVIMEEGTGDYAD